MAEGPLKFTTKAILAGTSRATRQDNTLTTITGQEEGKGCLRPVQYHATLSLNTGALNHNVGEHPRPVLKENHRLLQEIMIGGGYTYLITLYFCALLTILVLTYRNDRRRDEWDHRDSSWGEVLSGREVEEYSFEPAVGNGAHY